MGQNKFFAGMVGAISSLIPGRSRKRHDVKSTHVPAHERWIQPSPAGFGRNSRNRSLEAHRRRRKVRMRMARASRKRNRGQRRSQ